MRPYGGSAQLIKLASLPATTQDVGESLQFISNLYQQQFNKNLLETQLGIMATDVLERLEVYDLQSVNDQLSQG